MVVVLLNIAVLVDWHWLLVDHNHLLWRLSLGIIIAVSRLDLPLYWSGCRLSNRLHLFTFKFLILIHYKSILHILLYFLIAARPCLCFWLFLHCFDPDSVSSDHNILLRIPSFLKELLALFKLSNRTRLYEFLLFSVFTFLGVFSFVHLVFHGFVIPPWSIRSVNEWLLLWDLSADDSFMMPLLNFMFFELLALVINRPLKIDIFIQKIIIILLFAFGQVLSLINRRVQSMQILIFILIRVMAHLWRALGYSAFVVVVSYFLLHSFLPNNPSPRTRNQYSSLILPSYRLLVDVVAVAGWFSFPIHRTILLWKILSVWFDCFCVAFCFHLLGVYHCVWDALLQSMLRIRPSIISIHRSSALAVSANNIGSLLLHLHHTSLSASSSFACYLLSRQCSMIIWRIMLLLLL